jgi:hypothetical protein
MRGAQGVYAASALRHLPQLALRQESFPSVSGGSFLAM